MAEDRPHHPRATAVVAVIAAVALLKWGSAVAMPILLGLFAACVTLPFYRGVARRAGVAAGAACGLLVTIAISAAVVGLLALCAWQLSDHQAALKDGADQLAGWVRSAKDSLPFSDGASGTEGRLDALATRLIEGASGFALALGVQLLVLVEGRRIADLARRWDGADGGSRAATAEAAVTAVRRYFYVRTGVGLLTGVLVWLACLAVGLELALIYGAINFALNYFPTVGSVLGVIPPALLAMATSGDPTQAALALGVVGGVQIAMGVVVDPLIQGRTLACSATLVLTAVILGGWIGGVPGAFLAVPALLTLRCWAEGHGGCARLGEAIRLPSATS